MKPKNAFFVNLMHQYRVAQWELPICLGPSEKKLYSIHRRSSSHFMDELWFHKKRRLKIFFSRNQHINIVDPNENYPFVLAPREEKLDSIHERSSSHFKNKLWFQTKRRLEMFSFMKPMHQYPVSQWELPICISLTWKETRFYPQTKFISF